jgi:hypothetical protein
MQYNVQPHFLRLVFSCSRMTLFWLWYVTNKYQNTTICYSSFTVNPKELTTIRIPKSYADHNLKTNGVYSVSGSHMQPLPTYYINLIKSHGSVRYHLLY